MVTCVEAFTDNVDSRLPKSLSPGIGCGQNYFVLNKYETILKNLHKIWHNKGSSMFDIQIYRNKIQNRYEQDKFYQVILYERHEAD